jgi:zinc transporter ZupT
MVTISAISILPEVASGIFVTAGDRDDEFSFDFFLPGFGTNTSKTMVRTRLLLERLLSLGSGVSAYLLLAKLLVFLPDPEHMYLLDDPGEDEDYKRNYDLYLSSDDGDSHSGDDRMEKGLETTGHHSEPKALPLVRRRRKKKRTHRKKTLRDRMSSHDTLSSSSGTSDGLSLEDAEDLTAFAKERRKRSWRVALMLFTSLLIHNFPEGLCVVRAVAVACDFWVAFVDRWAWPLTKA